MQFREKFIPSLITSFFGMAILIARPVIAANPSTRPTDAQRINILADQLGSDNPDQRQHAANVLEDIPPDDLLLLQQTVARDDLSDATRSNLQELIKKIEPRLKSRARKKALEQQDQDSMQHLLLRLYQGGGHANPNWDDFAMTALSDFATVSSHSNKELLLHVKDEFQKAIDAGCDDPLVYYNNAVLISMIGEEDAATLFDLFRKSVPAVERDKKMPPLMKSLPHVWQINARTWGAGPPSEQMKQQLVLAIRHFNEGVGMGMVSAAVATRMADQIINAGHSLGEAKINLFNQLYPALDNAFPTDPSPLVLKARIYVDWGWQARGIGLSDTVTPQGWKDFSDGLAVAETALTRAYELDPDDPAAATEMLTVILGEQKGRNVMELWFQRAMQADPDNYDAHAIVRWIYLEPKWVWQSRRNAEIQPRMPR